MSVLCIILSQADRNEVAGGSEKGYLNGSHLNPIRRAGGGTNPDPCYILNTVVLTDTDFAAAAPYLSGLPQKWSDDENFPGPYEPPPEG